LQKDRFVLVEEIESAVDVLTNVLRERLKGPFYNWFINLEGLRNQNVQKQAVRLGDTPFTSMSIIRNDKRHAHKDDDALLGFIIWFTKGMYVFSIS
jgi:hypothetical protein